MNWKKLFIKILKGTLAGATAGIASTAINPNTAITSTEGIITTSITTLLVGALSGLSNYLKHKND